jgi:hypothetical protein
MPNSFIADSRAMPWLRTISSSFSVLLGLLERVEAGEAVALHLGLVLHRREVGVGGDGLFLLAEGDGELGDLVAEGVAVEDLRRAGELVLVFTKGGGSAGGGGGDGSAGRTGGLWSGSDGFFRLVGVLVVDAVRLYERGGVFRLVGIDDALGGFVFGRRIGQEAELGEAIAGRIESRLAGHHGFGRGVGVRGLARPLAGLGLGDRGELGVVAGVGDGVVGGGGVLAAEARPEARD